MTNITSALIETLNYNLTAAAVTAWPVDGIIDNGSFNEKDAFSTIITPLVLMSKQQQQHRSSQHPHLHHHVENFSFVTLSSEWSRLTRLLFLTILSCIGSVGNIFLISSVMIEDHLKKAGNYIEL